MTMVPQNVFATTEEAESFTIFAKALRAAGLVDTLQGEGPFTVFAPTDDAFAKIPKGEMDALFKDKPMLKATLLNHIVQGRVRAADMVGMKDGARIPNVSEGTFTIHLREGNLKVDKAKVIQTDIKASNGLIHVVDSVLRPR